MQKIKLNQPFLRFEPDWVENWNVLLHGCLQFQFLNYLQQMDVKKKYKMCEKLFRIMAGHLCLLYFLYLVIRLIPRIQFIPPCLPVFVFSNFSFSF